MSSRGSFTRNGHVTTNEYHVDHYVKDAKVLVGNHHEHNLPDYAHSHDSIYIKEYYDGSFRTMRIYDPDSGRVTLEIGYHPEPNIMNGDRHTPVLHFHVYDERLIHGAAQKLTPDNPIYIKYKKYLEEYGL